MSQYYRQGGHPNPYDPYADPQHQHQYSEHAPSAGAYSSEPYHSQQAYHSQQSYDAAQPEYQAAPIKPQR